MENTVRKKTCRKEGPVGNQELLCQVHRLWRSVPSGPIPASDNPTTSGNPLLSAAYLAPPIHPSCMRGKKDGVGAGTAPATDFGGPISSLPGSSSPWSSSLIQRANTSREKEEV